MICSKCGTPNDDTAKFCSSCGSPLSAPQQQTPPPAAPPAAPPAGAPQTAPPPMAAPGTVPPPPPMSAPGAAPVTVKKPYKAEFIMGLIGSIFAIIIWLVMLITGITASGFSYYGYGYGFGGGAIVGSFFVLAAFILGFIGTAQVNRGKGKGGIMLTIAGGLGFIAMFMGIWVGWSTIFFYPLLLAAGIMALARRKKVESGMY